MNIPYEDLVPDFGNQYSDFKEEVDDRLPAQKMKKISREILLKNNIVIMKEISREMLLKNNIVIVKEISREILSKDNTVIKSKMR